MPEVLKCNGSEGTVLCRKTFYLMIFSNHLFLD